MFDASNERKWETTGSKWLSAFTARHPMKKQFIYFSSSQSKSSRVAHGASKRRWTPQTTRDTSKGVQKYDESELNQWLKRHYFRSTLKDLES